jgi:ATP synthase protein I
MADDNNKGSLKDLVTAESMIQLALALPAGCVIGWLVGAGLDNHFHTTWIGITGILLGALGGFIQIFRTASKYLKRSGQ